MARDPLRVLQSVRLRAVTAARAALGACLAEEMSAEQQIAAIAGEATRDLAAFVPEAYRFGEMFARRGDVRRAELAAAGSELAAAVDRTAAARDGVVAARTAAETVSTLIAERAAAEATEESRRAQHTLDDICRRRDEG